MLVHAIAADGFRNLRQVKWQPHPRFNVLYGDNGQGKTNVLEAIYMLATMRSFRTSRIDEMIQFGGSAARLRARVEHRQVQRQLALEMLSRPTRKQAFVDGKGARTSDYFGSVNVVLFATEDLLLPKGPPAGRRHFLDRAIWNTYPSYLDEVRRYERALRSRNALLRSQLGRPAKSAPEAAQDEESGEDALPVGSAGIGDYIEVYDQQLASLGAVLMQRRRDYLNELAPQVAATFEQVSRSGLSVAMRYVPGVSGRGADLERKLTGAAAELAEALREQLQKNRRRDLLRGFTHSGPHADDIAFELDGRPADIHASQGQIRALVLSLKIAEIQHLSRILGEAPVLLLDDVSSELDPQRNAYLFEFLRAMTCQVFITTTSPTHVQIPQRAEDRTDVPVRAGLVGDSPEDGAEDDFEMWPAPWSNSSRSATQYAPSALSQMSAGAPSA